MTARSDARRLSGRRWLAAASALVCSPVWLSVLVASEGRAADEEAVSPRDDVLSIPADLMLETRGEARSTGFSHITATGLVAGYDTNVFRSPSSIDEGSALLGAGAVFKVDSRSSGTRRLKADVGLDATHYLGQDPLQLHNADVARFSAGLAYTSELSDALKVEAGLGTRYRSDDATSINGNKYVRDFSCWRHQADVMMTWDVRRSDRLEIGGSFVTRDYAETAGSNSLDWSAPGLDVRFRHRFGKRHYLSLWYSLTGRDYDEEPASFVDGTELPTNPAEEHRYQDVKVWYCVPAGDRVNLDFKYTYSQKRDLFQGYESYDEHTIEADVAVLAGEKTRLALGVEYVVRDFAHMTGDGGAPLAYDKLNVSVVLQRRLEGSAWLFGRYAVYSRDTNNSDVLSTVYRDYRGSVLTFGLGKAF